MPRWSDDEIQQIRNRGSFYMGAAICRRGHVETAFIDPRGPVESVAEMCPACGARVLSSCPDCGLRIRGYQEIPNVAGIWDENRPSFCDGCGAAFPWVTREERIFELENLLDEEEIDDADRIVIHDHLQQLRDASISERDERAAWASIKRRAGSALGSGPVKRAIEGLVNAAIRQQLGL